MIILLRRWNGNFPLWETTRSDFWFNKIDNSSHALTTWILSCSRLTWGYRASTGYLGEWSNSNDAFTYQWRCWTSEEFARLAYNKNVAIYNAEMASCRALSNDLKMTLVEVSAKIDINKDPAGLTPEELDEIIQRKL